MPDNSGEEFFTELRVLRGHGWTSMRPLGGYPPGGARCELTPGRLRIDARNRALSVMRGRNDPIDVTDDDLVKVVKKKMFLRTRFTFETTDDRFFGIALDNDESASFSKSLGQFLPDVVIE